MAGLYVHVPFCHAKCIYCDFYSVATTRRAREYVEAVAQEWRYYRREAAWPEVFTTLYLGGGTPSILSDELLQQLVAELPAATGERTIEANPEDITPERVALIRALGFNRVSLGVQSFCNEDLRFLGRRHTAHQARRAVQLLQQGGLYNISIDLIFALPDVPFERWQANVQAAVALHVPHLSAYGLTYEPRTLLEKKLRQGEVSKVSDDLYIRQYRYLIDALQAAGYEQYELSNFALPGAAARHNASYWRHVPYLGLGPGAHSFDGRRRRANVRSLPAYISALKEGRLPVEFTETLTQTDLYNEAIMLGLRTRQGVDLGYIQQRFGLERYRALLNQIVPLLHSGKLSLQGNQLTLTQEGLPVADAVIARLFS